jgi:SAM-dependent methyltransferase
MNIIETNKSRIRSLLKIALEQSGTSINSVNLEVNDDFNIEPFIPYLINDKWPHAVDPLLIADPNSEDDKVSRAHGILSIVISEPIVGKFLDFGCGEGHVVAEVANRGNVSVGYDILDQGWDRFTPLPNRVLTTSWDEVVSKGPYDFVLIYDVLDHMKDENEAVAGLQRIASVLSDKGRIFARLHPWCSRHGTHLYLSINRAFLHLCLSEESLDKLGYKYTRAMKIIHPLQTYTRWFDNVGLGVMSQNIISENVEPFFKQPAIASLIKKHWKESYQEELATGRMFPDWQLRQQFVDYVLEKKKV